MVSNQKVSSQQARRRSMLFLILSTSVILLAGMTTLFWQQQHRQITQADSAYVVGPPTLPAETVNSILAGTPMAGTGTVIEEASRNTNIDDAFALGVWWTETNDGAAGVGLSYRNPGGVRSSAGYAVGGGGYTIYPSYAAAINDWFDIVESRYINRGLTSVYTICNPYVGTSSATSWANKVYNLMIRYHAMAPAPTPTPIPPTPTPTPKPRDWEQEQPVVLVHPKQTKQSPPIPTPAKPKPVVVSATIPALIAKNQNLVLGMGLLGSVMLAGLGVVLRRRTPVSIPAASPSLPITTALAVDGFNQLNVSPLYADKLSLVSNHYAPSLAASEFEPLEAASEPATAPLKASPEPATAPILAVSGGGLLTRYGGSGVGPRHAPFKTPIVQEKPSFSTNEEKSPAPLAFDSSYDPGPTTTGGLPTVHPHPGIALPARDGEAILEMMAAGKAPAEKPKGLLSRYRDNTL